MKLCNVLVERRKTVRRVGSDKLASLTLQELAKCNPQNFMINEQNRIIKISAAIMQYMCKYWNEKSQKMKLITNKTS